MAEDAIEAGRHFLEAWQTRSRRPRPRPDAPPSKVWCCFRCLTRFVREPKKRYVTAAGTSACPLCWKRSLQDLEGDHNRVPAEKAEPPDPPPAAPVRGRPA